MANDITPAPGGAVPGILSHSPSLVLFVIAPGDMGTDRTGACFSTASLVVALIALAFPREPVTLPFGIAATLTGAGVWLHITGRHEHEHRHEAMEHEHVHEHDEHHRREPMTLSHPHCPDALHTHRH